MARSTRPQAALPQGCRILVVEDEYMLAKEVSELLVNAGADALGPVARASAALKLVAAQDRIDCALLDVNLYGELIWPVVDALQARSIPLVLTTGYDASAIPPAYTHLLRLEKPTSGREIMRAILHVLAGTGPH